MTAHQFGMGIVTVGVPRVLLAARNPKSSENCFGRNINQPLQACFLRVRFYGRTLNAKDKDTRHMKHTKTHRRTHVCYNSCRILRHTIYL